jgi:site-specific recombinase XerD
MSVQLEAAMKVWLAVHPGGPLAFCKNPGEPFTAQMAAHYFYWSVDGGKWAVVKGFHAFRHSFISNLAAKGVGDHVIMALVGHLNRETTKRYLHLRPATLEDAVCLLFGKRPLVADAE